MDDKDKLNLVAKLIDSKTQNRYFKEFTDVLYNDFLEFSNADNHLANETKLFLNLKAIEKELGVISAYPDLYNKNIIAVGGGFSSGKSEFISSFLQTSLKLPIGVVPTTAIPTFVIENDDNKVLAISFKNTNIEVDKEFHKKLSHNFISSFGFNLKELMPFMIIASKMKYDKICFLDTPGYNPADSSESFTEEDVNTSKEFLQNSNTLIWLIGLDSNGTISSSDLEFLEALELENKDLFIVLNKADLKPKDDLEDIIQSVCEYLDDDDINFSGVSAFSSTMQEEFVYEKKSLLEFLDNKNINSIKYDEISNKLKNIYCAYKYALIKKEKENEAQYSYIKSILLDMMENSDDESIAYDKIQKLQANFKLNNPNERIKKLDRVFEKLQSKIDGIFSKKANFNFEELDIGEIEIDFEASKKEDQFETVEDKDFLIDELNDCINSLK
ncbi:dynamin family protein [Sulfurimonas sp. NW15]|uniref:dynamin family protein n=1 Tax=Sulfurimonas sp. NW15 TaxID=2922729 RepID=UPI003DA9BCE7